MARGQLEVWAARLGRADVLAALDPAARTELARAARSKPLRRQQHLFRHGSEPDAIAFVLAGRLDIVRDTEHGRKLLLRSLGPDSIVGLSTIAGAAHSADVVAGVASQVLMIPGSVLRRVLARDPAAALRSVAHLADLLARLTDEVEDLRGHDLPERLRRRLVRLADEQRIVSLTHAELAAMVGATRANVSRALARLEQARVLRRHRGRIELR